MILFQELNLFLESLRPRLEIPSSLGSTSKTIAIAILAHLLGIVARATRLFKKRPWLGHLGAALSAIHTKYSLVDHIAQLCTGGPCSKRRKSKRPFSVFVCSLISKCDP